MSVLEDFPIGCAVSPIDEISAELMSVKITSIGTVIFNDNVFLGIDWGDNRKLSSHDGWYANRFKRVYSQNPIFVNKNSFCICGSENVVKNFVLGKQFLYCRNCRKEREQ